MFISVQTRSASRRRPVILLVATAFAAAGAAVVATVPPAAAAAETCQGQSATIVATADQQTLTGTDGPDVISTAGYLNVKVLAGGGDDLVCTDGGSTVVGSGAGEVLGGSGDDTLVASASASRSDLALLEGEGGDDVLQVERGAAYLRPGAGDDQIHVPAAPELENGSPTIWVSFGLDVAHIDVDVPAGTVDGEGHDTFTGVMGFEGTSRPDVFKGGPAADFFNDGAIDEDPHPGADHVSGGGGDDRFEVLAGEVDGGPGDDVLDGMHSVVKGGAGDDRIFLFEGGRALGGPGADVIRTDIDRESVLGRVASPFHLDGGTGPDRIFLASPADEIGFKPCSDRPGCSFRADGGPGKDVLSFQRTGGHVHLDLARGRASYFGGDAAVRGFEHVEGSPTSDVLRGTAHADHLDGNGGPDRLFGRGGPDLLHGGGGHDVAFGGPGRDRCVAEVKHNC